MGKRSDHLRESNPHKINPCVSQAEDRELKGTLNKGLRGFRGGGFWLDGQRNETRSHRPNSGEG